VQGFGVCKLQHIQEVNMKCSLRVCLSAMLLLSVTSVMQAAAPNVTFGASVTNANGSLSTRLTWDAPGATGCTAAGHPSWTGTKAASGSQDLPVITLSGTYTLTLNCAGAGNAVTVISWDAVTENTDGSAITDLAGYKIYHGMSPNAISEVVQLGLVTSYTFNQLADGTHYFAMSAYNASGVEGALSATGTKVVTNAVTQSAGVTLTVNPVPGAVKRFSIDAVPVP
jgi:hypothetical protein